MGEHQGGDCRFMVVEEGMRYSDEICQAMNVVRRSDEVSIQDIQ